MNNEPCPREGLLYLVVSRRQTDCSLEHAVKCLVHEKAPGEGLVFIRDRQTLRCHQRDHLENQCGRAPCAERRTRPFQTMYVNNQIHFVVFCVSNLWFKWIIIINDPIRSWKFLVVTDHRFEGHERGGVRNRVADTRVRLTSRDHKINRPLGSGSEAEFDALDLVDYSELVPNWAFKCGLGSRAWSTQY
jgi:hypothetical protein